MKKLLITGASGYLGSVLLKRVPQDWDVVALDLREPDFGLSPNIRFIKGSINDELLISGALGGVDLILHLAALKGSDNCRKNPVDAVEINICGTHNLIKCALLNKIKKFIFLSSYWVYGDSGKRPFIENTLPCPSELYGLSKFISEQEIILSGMDYSIIRFSNVFGFGNGRASDDVIFNFIKSSFEKRPLKLFAAGKNRMDFIDIEDACECLLKIVSLESKPGCILNVGSGKPVSIFQLAQIVRNVFKKEFNINVKTEKTGSNNIKLPDRYVSIDNLSKRIGRVHFKGLEESIATYARQYKEFHDKSRKAIL